MKPETGERFCLDSATAGRAIGRSTTAPEPYELPTIHFRWIDCVVDLDENANQSLCMI
ncbi:hypothetical protein KR100_13195 [Synechococcus sp. KORDI-100]|nr:hypothetical protein KR100_13195 [Synechococcus sp. KORDI-100]